MNQLQTLGIVLTRIDYGEADRIVTFLTPGQGKLRLMARGVRKVKSKLAGGIELFSISDISYLQGRGDIGTLVSTRLKTHYGKIVTDIERVQLGYELIKMLNKATEDEPESEYFQLLEQAFAALNDMEIDLTLIQLWFEAQLLRLSGHQPNLRTDAQGNKLDPEGTYNFDFEAVAFSPHSTGRTTAAHIKTLRLLFGHHVPATLNQVQGLPALLPETTPLIQGMLSTYVHV